MRKHGMFGTPIYGSWSAMLYRCRNPRSPAYKNYGGRGISVCPRWYSFEAFYADMAAGHWVGAEIDRIDPNGNYEPANCRWVSTKDNVRNKRNAVVVVYQGCERNLAQLCEELEVSRPHVLSRLKLGWDLEKALNAAVATRRRHSLEYQGGTYTIRQLSEMSGLTENTVRGRLLRGHSVESAISRKE